MCAVCIHFDGLCMLIIQVHSLAGMSYVLMGSTLCGLVHVSLPSVWPFKITALKNAWNFCENFLDTDTGSSQHTASQRDNYEERHLPCESNPLFRVTCCSDWTCILCKLFHVNMLIPVHLFTFSVLTCNLVFTLATNTHYYAEQLH